jgi:hypothetical protein
MIRLRHLCLFVIATAELGFLPAELDVEDLPPLEEVLQELQLAHYEQRCATVQNA